MNNITTFQILFEPIILLFFLPRSPQQIIFISISLASRTKGNSFIIFVNFITWRELFFKSEVSIDKDSKREYLDKRTGEFSIIVVVEVSTFFYITSLSLISFQTITIDVLFLR